MTTPTRTAIAVLLAIVGIVWLGQGFGVISGSFMTGQLRWAAAGGGMLAVSALVWRGRRGSSGGGGG